MFSCLAFFLFFSLRWMLRQEKVLAIGNPDNAHNSGAFNTVFVILNGMKTYCIQTKFDEVYRKT